jgi:Spy/CpxP family protein refolding chaperone
MNRTKLLTIAVIGLLLINLGTLGVLIMRKPPRPPHGEMPPPPPPGEGPKQLIIDRLRFDDAQQKQYDVIIEEHKKKTNELHDASRDMHNQLYALLKTEPVDKAKADALIQQIADNQKAVDNLNFDHFQKIKSICKPDQVEDFNELAGELAALFGPKGPPPSRP